MGVGISPTYHFSYGDWTLRVLDLSRTRRVQSS
jgi:hypothetical protein